MASSLTWPTKWSVQPRYPVKPVGYLADGLGGVFVPAWGSAVNGLSCPDVVKNRAVSQTGTSAQRAIGRYGIGTQWPNNSTLTYEKITGASPSGIPYTVFALARYDNSADCCPIWYSCNASAGILLRINAGGAIHWVKPGSADIGGSSGTIAQGESAAFAGTVDASGNWKTWLRGKQDGSGTASDFGNATYNDSIIGSDIPDGATYQGRKTIFAVYWWYRVLSNNELLALFENPWAVFPAQRRLYFGASGGGASATLTGSGASSATFDGSSTANAALSAAGAATAAFTGQTAGSALSGAGASSASFVGNAQFNAALSAGGTSAASFAGASQAASALSASGASTASFDASVGSLLSISGDSSAAFVGASNWASTLSAAGAAAATFNAPVATKQLGYSPVPLYLPDERQHRRLIAELANNILSGKVNCTANVTLTASATSTTLSDPRIGPYTHFAFLPLTANAASAASGIYVSAQEKGSATITHASSSNTDQNFRVAILG